MVHLHRIRDFGKRNCSNLLLKYVNYDPDFVHYGVIGDNYCALGKLETDCGSRMGNDGDVFCILDSILAFRV